MNNIKMEIYKVISNLNLVLKQHSIAVPINANSIGIPSTRCIFYANAGDILTLNSLANLSPSTTFNSIISSSLYTMSNLFISVKYLGKYQ
jgi:hypothetical protein